MTIEGTRYAKPILQSLLIADRVYTDNASGKKIIAGVFQTLAYIPNDVVKAHMEREGQPPAPMMQGGFDAGSPYAYISLTEVRGEQQFSLRYVSLQDDRALIEATLVVKSDDPLKTIELVVPLPRLPVPEPGIFALELLWGDENVPLGMHRIRVTEVQIPEQDNDPSHDSTND